MIDACAKASDLAGAELWHTRMIEAGIEASNHSFGPVISACAKAGDVDKAESLLDQMARLGIKPDVVAFSSVIDACSKAGDADRAELVFMRMRDNGVTPNIVAYSSLARPFARQGDWRKVEELEKEMQKDGLKMNDYFLYTLLDAYCCARPQQEGRAERAFRRAAQSGVRVNDYVRGQLCKLLGFAEAQRVIADWKAVPLAPKSKPLTQMATSLRPGWAQ